MHKIYAFNNGGSRGWMSAVAIADDGRGVAGHICSDEYFMPHDLGVTSDWKHENYDKYFGAGNWEIEWVPSEAINDHAGLQAAFELNKTAPPPPDDEVPGATVTMVDDAGKESTIRVGP